MAPCARLRVTATKSGGGNLKKTNVVLPRLANAGGFAGFGLAVDDGRFVYAEACGGGREGRPIGAFVSEEDVVDVAVLIGGAAERGADFGRDREAGEDLLHRAVEDGVGDREQTHEEEVGAQYRRGE